MNRIGISITFEELRHSCGTTRKTVALKIVKYPKEIGSSGWIRTSNPPVNSRMLCR
jgi:hypothetical protein